MFKVEVVDKVTGKVEYDTDYECETEEVAKQVVDSLKNHMFQKDYDYKIIPLREN